MCKASPNQLGVGVDSSNSPPASFGPYLLCFFFYLYLTLIKFDVTLQKASTQSIPGKLSPLGVPSNDYVKIEHYRKTAKHLN